MTNSVEQELMHFGVLGMKWGVRRQRGPDGTVKSGGSQGSGDYQKSRKMLKRGAKNLSNKEMKELTNRLNLEKQLRDLNPGSYKQGMNFAKTAIATSATLSSLYAISQTPLAKKVQAAVDSRLLDVAYKKAMGG